MVKGYQTYGVRMCWHILPHCLSVGTLLCLLGDRMSQIAEPSRVQLCLCSPNRGETAKSWLLAVCHILVSVLWWWKEPLEEWETGCQKRQVGGSILLNFFGSILEFVCMPTNSVSPDSDLVRMWTAWVREDEHSQSHFLPTAQTCHWYWMVVVSTWHSLYACKGNTNINIYRLRRQHVRRASSVSALMPSYWKELKRRELTFIWILSNMDPPNRFASYMISYSAAC